MRGWVGWGSQDDDIFLDAVTTVSQSVSGRVMFSDLIINHTYPAFPANPANSPKPCQSWPIWSIPPIPPIPPMLPMLPCPISDLQNPPCAIFHITDNREI